MEITAEFLSNGASAANGYTRRQIELLGLCWPPSKGWKNAIIGTEISDQNADEFLCLSGSGSRRTKRLDSDYSPVNWCGVSEPVDIFLYVLALEDDRYYVGLSSDVSKRMEQHFSSFGAEWTKRYRPIRLIHSINTGTQDGRHAEVMEDEATIVLMMKYGIEKVRGGHFSQVDIAQMEPALRAYGVWDRLKQNQYQRIALDMEMSWSEALNTFLDVACRFYDADKTCAPTLRDEVFAAGYRLTRFPHWRETFTPGLGWAFWNPKGILPILMSFKLRRPVASKQSCSYEVLAAALSRSRNGASRLYQLYLLAWQAYQPPMSDNQAESVSRFVERHSQHDDVNHEFDDIVSVLFPEMRFLLRSNGYVPIG